MMSQQFCFTVKYNKLGRNKAAHNVCFYFCSVLQLLVRAKKMTKEDKFAARVIYYLHVEAEVHAYTSHCISMMAN